MAVLGVDGWRGRWVGALLDGRRVTLLLLPDAAAVLAVPDAEVVGIDMPIGLSDDRPPRLRRRRAEAARAGRQLGVPGSRPGGARLRRLRSACAVSRAAAKKAISVQTWNLVPAIRSLDDALGQPPDPRVAEVHPELSFRALDARVRDPKATARGLAQRIRALAAGHGRRRRAGARAPPAGPRGRLPRRLRGRVVGRSRPGGDGRVASATAPSTGSAGRCGSRGERPVSETWVEVADGVLVRRHRCAGPQLRAGPGRRRLPRRRHPLPPGRGGRPGRGDPRGHPAPVDRRQHPRPLRPLLRQRRLPPGADLGLRRLRGRSAGRAARASAPTWWRRCAPPATRTPTWSTSVPIDVPDRLVDDAAILDVGGREVVLRFLGPRAHRPRPRGGGGGGGRRHRGLRRRSRGGGRPAGVRGRLPRRLAGHPRPAARAGPRPGGARPRRRRRRGVRRRPARELLAVLAALRAGRPDRGPYDAETMRTAARRPL